MNHKIIIILFVTIFLIITGITQGLEIKNDEKINYISNSNVYNINLTFDFSDPILDFTTDNVIVNVKETNQNGIIPLNLVPSRPVLPVNISVFNLPFGSKITNFELETSIPQTIKLPVMISGCRAKIDSIFYEKQDNIISCDYESLESYPSDWVTYRTGGGLNLGEHVTYLVTRINPVRYYPDEYEIKYVKHIDVNISYETSDEKIIPNYSRYDLLVLSPNSYVKHLKPLVTHKEKQGVKTYLESLETVYEKMYFQGRDEAEKIKYYIKNAIENWGIKHVLLVGGIKGQGYEWNLPIRYSNIPLAEKGEIHEEYFIADLYYADIYNGDGSFSSWDSNDDNKFSFWDETSKDEMDLYPDVYLGRIPCRNIYEVKLMVDKIIKYEETKAEDEWFKKLVLIGGDSYNDPNQFNEGKLICDKASDLMPDFTAVKVYAEYPDSDINRKTVNDAINPGCGFLYFCGHGSEASWGTHYPPATNTNWVTGYHVKDMITLHNGYKQPICVIGGCHNGEFDRSIIKSITNGIQSMGLEYFKGYFWFSGWIPNCFSWYMTSKTGGGCIACIANTGLGTHGEGDVDNNGIADYLEVLNGWMELRFHEIYEEDVNDMLGVNHGQTITEYIHMFIEDESLLDVKMAQQWQLFGDPSLKIGGYI